MPNARRSVEEGWDGSIVWRGLGHSTEHSLRGHLSSLAPLAPGFSQAISLALKCDPPGGLWGDKALIEDLAGKNSLEVEAASCQV